MADDVRMTTTVSSTFFALLRLLHRVFENIGLNEVLQDVAKVVCEVTGATAAKVYFYDESTSTLRSRVALGPSMREIAMPINGKGFAAWCFRKQKSLMVEDAYGDLSKIDPELTFDTWYDEEHDFHTKDVICVPIWHQSKVLGVLEALNKKHGKFEERHLQRADELTSVVGIALHHSKLYDNLASLKELDKMKSNFVRVLVHELKSPVGAAQGMIDMMLRYELPQEKSKEYTERIKNRLQNLTGLIQELHRLAKVQSGQPMGEIKPVDVSELVREQAEIYREGAVQKNITVNLDIAGNPPPIWIDSATAPFVFSNLISNAIKYSPSGKSVNVKVYAEGNNVCCSVADQGIGIPKDDVPNLFREFYRASNARGSDIEGTGLGLAAVKKIVDRFGGNLRVESEEGKGSTFYVSFPGYDARRSTVIVSSK